MAAARSSLRVPADEPVELLPQRREAVGHRRVVGLDLPAAVADRVHDASGTGFALVDFGFSSSSLAASTALATVAISSWESSKAASRPRCLVSFACPLGLDHEDVVVTGEATVADVAQLRAELGR
jgi:hypothetical protein